VVGINATARMTGKSKNTAWKPLADVGEACAAYRDRAMNNMACSRSKSIKFGPSSARRPKNVNDSHPEGYGDSYTFTAIDPDTKLTPCWLVGTRSKECTECFMNDMAPRMANRIQFTSDGMGPYPNAVFDAFGWSVDYGILYKHYADEGSVKEAKRRYSPAPMISSEKHVAIGNPDMAHISTSHVEPANLSVRMGMRRFTRLTKRFQQEAMKAGATDFLWSMEDIVLKAGTMGS
jgi:hypothetical protein